MTKQSTYLEEIKEEIQKCTQTNDSENIQNLWEAAKAVLRKTFTVMPSYLKKQEKSRKLNFAPKAARERTIKRTQR